MTQSPEPPARLRIRGTRKSFGATKALDGVDLQMAPGEVHALIGENGAGKSTLMKVLSGVYQPDDGHIEIDGKAFAPSNPLDARKQGVAMIYQELALAPHLSAAENIVLGVEPHRSGWLDSAETGRLAKNALKRLGHPDISPGAIASTLSIGARQLVEIARALVTEAKIIVLDEPTSSLARPDVQRLFEVIRKLCESGVSVVYISHFLEEVEQIADSYTVLRDGRSIARGRMRDSSLPEIVQAMVGRELTEMFPRVPHKLGQPILEIAKLSAPGVGSANLHLHRGEIFGIAGLIGAGRTEMLRAVFGLAPITSGEVRLASYQGPASPAERLRQGAGLLSEDRKNEGLAVSLAVEENLVLSRMGRYSRWGWLDRAGVRKAASKWIEKLAVRTAGPEAPVQSLSGGNQQKVQLARLLHHDCEVFLLDEPTRGIDVASKVLIYEWIGKLAASGKAIIFVSSYVPELLEVCDTLAVMHRGMLGRAAPVKEWSERSIMLAATGAAS